MRKWVAVLLVIGLMIAGLTGCSSKNESAGTNAPAATDTKTNQGSTTDLSSLMKSASQVKGMSFDVVTTITDKDNTTTSTGKFYMSNGKVRIETEVQGMKMITITKDSGEVYMYNPSTNTAMKITAPQDEPELPTDWASADADVSGLKVVGEENKDGYDCIVVTASDNSKMWIRKDIGMPVRIESTSADGTMVMEYKNYNIGAQADDLFELPAGAQVMEMPTMPDMSNIPKQ